MPKLTVNYRNEFSAEITAKNPKEAIEKFKNGEGKIKVISGLWDEYFEVRRGERFLKETGSY